MPIAIGALYVLIVEYIIPDESVQRFLTHKEMETQACLENGGDTF